MPRVLMLILGLYILSGSLQNAIDDNGYIVYCPCMGRFGNQAEQFLGALQFANSLNRTLVLPPFIEYNRSKVTFVPFSQYIDIEPLRIYHRVIEINHFMDEVAPEIWPEDNRTIFCYTGRYGATLQGCNPFEGSPFKPFWHHLNITTFMSSTLYQPLQVNYSQASQWRERFKSVKVIAFVGAPSAFPTNHEATLLQKHVQLSNKVATLAKAFQEESGFLNHVYVGVHLRHGSDWENACKLLESEQDMKVLFSSQQCTNDLPLLKQEDSLPYGLCLPPKDIVVKDIGNALKLVNRTDKALAVYIATDSDDLDLWDRLTKLHPSIKFITPSATYKDQKIYYHTRPSPIIDIYLLTYSDYFIGNCISSFSAFCSRQRLSRLKLAKPSTSFFALNLLESPNFETTKTEL